MRPVVDPDEPQDGAADTTESPDSTATDLPPVDPSTTAPSLLSTTAPSLPPSPSLPDANATVAMLEPVAPDTVAGLEPVPSPPVAPPRKKTKNEVPAVAAEPRKKTKGETPAVDLAGDTAPRIKRHPTKGEVRAQGGIVPKPGPDTSTDPAGTEPFRVGVDESTDPRQRRVASTTEPGGAEPRFELTPVRVATGAGLVAVLAIVAWLVIPALTRPKHVEHEPTGPTPPEPIVLKEPIKKAPPPPKPVEAPPKPPEPTVPTLSLDTHINVIDPYGHWAPEIALDGSHKYSLAIRPHDARLGTVLSRLNEKGAWGVMHLMAEHAPLRFGGASALRLHCEPGSRYADNAAIPLDLEDLARRKKTSVSVTISKDCYDFSNARKLELGETKYRVRLPAEQKVKLGEKIPLRVAWRVQASTDPVIWRGGVLEAGGDVLVEGVFAQFAVLDPYTADNEGEVKLELLPPDTQSSGLVKQ